MPERPNLFTPEPPELGKPAPAPALRAARGVAGAAAIPRAQQQYRRWLVRTELLVRVIVRLYLGLLITALPWMRFWTENGLLNFNRTASTIAASGFTRGLVSGLGVLNVFMALQELLTPRSGH